MCHSSGHNNMYRKYQCPVDSDGKPGFPLSVKERNSMEIHSLVQDVTRYFKNLYPLSVSPGFLLSHRGGAAWGQQFQLPLWTEEVGNRTGLL